MTPNQHISLLGGIMTNLHYLEFKLRRFLLNAQKIDTTELWDEWHGLKLGAVVPANRLTDYSSLGKLIEDYNKLVPAEHQVALAVVDLRDALAHGRVTTLGSFPMKLVKFSKVVGGKVTVEFAQTLGTEWMHEQMKWVVTQHERIPNGN